jgi:hypothetical protein
MEMIMAYTVWGTILTLFAALIWLRHSRTAAVIFVLYALLVVGLAVISGGKMNILITNLAIAVGLSLLTLCRRKHRSTRTACVYVGPSSANEQQPRPHSRFGGMLAGVLSLRSEGRVSRDQIVGLLGEPVAHYDLSTMQEQDRVQRISALIAELRTNVLSSAIRWPSSGERLAYPQRGIYLELVSNTVWEIGIAKPGEQGAALPRAPQPGHSEGAR